MNNQNSTENVKEHYLGEISTKSGFVMISDPCYIRSQWSDLIFEKAKNTLKHRKNASFSLSYSLGHDGFGIIVPSLNESDNLPVYIYMQDLEDWGERVINARIDFVPKETQVSNVERLELGSVGVDSGQLMFIDPQNIVDEWVVESDEIVGVKAWGQASDSISEKLTELFPKTYTTQLGSLKLDTTSHEEAKNFISTVKKLAEEIDQVIVWTTCTKDTYDSVSETTLNSPNTGGIVPFNDGTEGLLAAFSTGLGDGYYDVFANVGHIEGHGEVILSLEVDFF